MTPLAQLTDAAESIGATVTTETRPTHPDGRTRYPAVTVTYRGRRTTCHHATMADGCREAMRWLQAVAR